MFSTDSVSFNMRLSQKEKVVSDIKSNTPVLNSVAPKTKKTRDTTVKKIAGSIEYKDFAKKASRNFLLSQLRLMMRIRKLEDKAGYDYRLRKIGGFCHLCAGQEAVCAATIGALDLTKDYVLTSYRDHGHALACGISTRSIFAELYGKAEGCSKGKGGSMHLFSVENNFLGGNGIVGAQIPIATGVAFAQKYKNVAGVTLCYFGDGALQQGAFHESLNLSKLWNLPVIYVIENNYYGMGTAVQRASSVEDLYTAGSPYQIEGCGVNGMDFYETYNYFASIVASVRKNPRPVLVEAKTYRYYGHSMSDPANYRSKKELDDFKEKDPIFSMKKKMIKDKQLTENEFKAMEKETAEEIKKAQEEASKSHDPKLEELYTDVIA